MLKTLQLFILEITSAFFFPPLFHYYIVNKTFEKIGKQHKDINISHDAQHISHENYSVPSFNL